MKALEQWMVHNRISVFIDYSGKSVDDKLVLVKENYWMGVSSFFILYIMGILLPDVSLDYARQCI